MITMKDLKTTKFGLGILLMAGLNSPVNAQKLKSVQEGNVRAPSNIKIDGKLSEWNDAFQAYNTTTSLSYTVSNDDNYLYLAVKSTDQMNSNKIAAAGLNFTINTADKKKEAGAFALIFPIANKSVMTGMLPQHGGPGGPGDGFGGGPGGGAPGNPFILDSATADKLHKTTIDGAKEIKLVGFKDIPDSVISIYNEYGIKAAINYDTKGNLTYEAAVPLKLLGLSTDNPKEFYYNVKINAIQLPDRGKWDDGDRGGRVGDGGGFSGPPGGGDGGGRGGFGGPPGGGPGGPGGAFHAMLSSTDFWGKYMLAKNN